MKKFVDLVFICLFSILLIACIAMACTGAWWNLIPAAGLVALVITLAAERRRA